MAAVTLCPEAAYEISDGELDEFAQICKMHLDTPATMERGRDSYGWTVKELRDGIALCVKVLKQRAEW
jgi:hypothetical protein